MLFQIYPYMLYINVGDDLAASHTNNPIGNETGQLTQKCWGSKTPNTQWSRQTETTRNKCKTQRWKAKTFTGMRRESQGQQQVNSPKASAGKPCMNVKKLSGEEWLGAEAYEVVRPGEGELT